SPCPWRRVYRQRSARRRPGSGAVARPPRALAARIPARLPNKDRPAGHPPLPQAPDKNPSTDILRIENVRFGYDERPVLDGVDMAFRRGTVTALMGRSEERRVGKERRGRGRGRQDQ